MSLERRKWIPDPTVIADQLIEDYRHGGDDGQGSLDIIGTVQSWKETAQFHGDEFTEDDWIALVQELVHRIALGGPAA